jgi:hypothetical protein
MKLEDKDVQVGDWISVRAEKEKSTRPHQQATFIFDNEEGRIDPYSEIIQLGLEDELIERHGNTFQYESVDGEDWSGSEKQFRKYLIENDDLFEELYDAISDTTVESAKVDDDG